MFLIIVWPGPVRAGESWGAVALVYTGGAPYYAAAWKWPTKDEAIKQVMAVCSERTPTPCRWADTAVATFSTSTTKVMFGDHSQHAQRCFGIVAYYYADRLSYGRGFGSTERAAVRDAFVAVTRRMSAGQKREVKLGESVESGCNDS